VVLALTDSPNDPLPRDGLKSLIMVPAHVGSVRSVVEKREMNNTAR